MKTTLAFLLMMTYALSAFAEVDNAEFCQDYEKDQKRISEVKKNGWVKGTIKKEYLYGCLDLKWRDQLYQNLCLNQKNEIRLPKAIMFYFDGFGNFLPGPIKKSHNAVNLTGDEPAGSIKAGVYFLRYLLPSINDSIKYREGYNDVEPMNKFDKNKDIQFHYHSGSGTDKIQGLENATVCYSSMLKDLKLIEERFPALPQPKKIIMGFSNGADSAIKFVNHFTTEEDAEFDVFASIDPVPKAGGFIKNKITFSETVFKLEHPEKISQSMNYYQKTNEAVMAGIIGIKGSKLDGVGFEKELFVNHSQILVSYEVMIPISQVIASLFYPEVSKEQYMAKNAKLKLLEQESKD